MKSGKLKLAADPRSRRDALAVAASVWLVGVLVFFASPLGRDLEERIALPVSFQFRHWAGKSPSLDSRIKIYAVDDATVQFLKREDLTLQEWLKVLNELVPTRPKAVVFDRVFSNPLGVEHADEFVTGVKALPFPVYAGAFSSGAPINGLKALETDRSEWDLREAPGGGDLAAWDWLSISPGTPYGPNPAILGAFRGLGHLHHEGPYFTPWVRFSQKGAIPFLALLPTGGDPGKVRRAVVDFMHPARYYERTAALKSLLKGKTPQVEEGSIVLFLTHMHTGGTDFHDSPFGRIPGGYWIASVLNSSLSHRWLRPVPWPAVSLFTACAFGAAVGLVVHTLSFWSLMVTGLLGFLTFGLAGFSWLGLATPWLACVTGFGTAGLLTFFLGHRRREAEWELLQVCLEGALPSGELRKWIGRGERLMKPSGQVLSILFLDIVGFSRVAERQSPEEAFAHLRDLITWITNLVHEHGGIVDKTLGDGLLCFFGLSGEEKAVRHADQALRCAVRIQRESAKRMIERGRANQPVFPLRIGINTAGVFLGNLGSGKRIDLTVIGQGVNLARRYEEACETGRILIGRSTSDLLLGGVESGVSLVDRWISIKHVTELQKVIEVDPFEQDPRLLSEAIAAHRKFLGVERVDERWTIPAGVNLSLQSPLGQGVVVNFSQSGLGIRFSRFLGKSSMIPLQVADTDLICEVRWGTAMKAPQGAYYLGLEIKNLTFEQRKVWVEAMRRTLTKSAA